MSSKETKLAVQRAIEAAKSRESALRDSSSVVSFSSSSDHQFSDSPVDVSGFLDDDTTFNFRVNSELKKEFSLICKRDHLSAASALKRYMTTCVRIGVLK